MTIFLTALAISVLLWAINTFIIQTIKSAWEGSYAQWRFGTWKISKQISFLTFLTKMTIKYPRIFGPILKFLYEKKS